MLQPMIKFCFMNVFAYIGLTLIVEDYQSSTAALNNRNTNP